ncbi:MAG: 3-oxoacyl-ACP reductase FabG [Albidovulum sp.]|nr:3-oxoacyl-ACP reductase FabG [Albidovulum sp.]MDE0307326.1 3-oxoacyl-ACP reductase FabG [Albidovulum sp.]MDE0531701.1 3-oxoacyl-ACP reductase FabG [Albidovulum sp.]
MFSPVTGKSVIVTGGSKGIGRGIAKVFAREGANVAIASRGEEAGKVASDEISSACGGTAYHVPCDVSDWESVKSMAETVAARSGGIDVLCANAGAFPQTKIVDMEPSEWDQVLATNLKSAFLCVKACIPFFERAGKGRVVLTSSITGPVTGFPGWSHYGASKSGQLGFLKTAAMELSRYGTTINAVMPGNIYTEGLQDLGEDYLKTMAASIPLKRLGDVEDIGHAALFFASDEASYITGQQIVVDGGQIIPESLEAIDEI